MVGWLGTRTFSVALLGLWSLGCAEGVTGGLNQFGGGASNADDTGSSEGEPIASSDDAAMLSEGSDASSSGDSSSGESSGAPMASCGDSVAQGDESCDGQDLLGQGCTDFGYTAGVLACGPDCTIITEACFSCGDGTKGLAEPCDGPDFGGETCETQGFGGGTLSCASDCSSLVTTGCVPLPTCGDGVRNGAEQCDAADLGGSTCQAQGFDVGSLACNPVSCTYDTSGCDLLNCTQQGQFCLFNPDNPQSTCCPAGVGGNILGLCSVAVCV